MPAENNPQILFKRARAVMPGGVNSPVRAFNAVGGTPVVVEQGRGSRFVTTEGRELIDFCGAWGPLVLGHAHPEVIDEIQQTVAKGTGFGTSTRIELELAELICEQIPYFDEIRLVNSGTEAVMTALRLARGCTGRRKILKFDGCYHGHADNMLVGAGSGLLTRGVPTSDGIPENLLNDILVVPYNDLQAVEKVVDAHGDELAAIIVEPLAANMGLVPPAPGFLEGLRSITDKCGTFLIFDEVITGFRLGPTTYGNIGGVVPDLTCLGKIIGGGLPVGAVGGGREVMEKLAPVGDVYQAGTLSGNPVTCAAGLATLRILLRDNPYPRLAELGAMVRREISVAGKDRGGLPCCAQQGGMFTLFFAPSPIRNRAEAGKADLDAYAGFFHSMLMRGFYLPPSQFEVAFISAAHSETDVKLFIEAVMESL